MAYWDHEGDRLVHCLVEVWVGESDPHQCLVEGSEIFVVAALCFGALKRAAWSIPSVRYSNGGGVVVSAENEAIEFTCVEGGVVYWGGIVRGWGGDERRCVVEARHDIYVEG